MSSPMADLPEHVMIGVDAEGNGPVEEGEPRFARYVCWCGREGCTEYRL